MSIIHIVSCIYYKSKVYDGGRVNNALLKRLSGGLHHGTTAQSTSKKMFVYFQSNRVDGFQGFNANYFATITGMRIFKLNQSVHLFNASFESRIVQYVLRLL